LKISKEGVLQQLSVLYTILGGILLAGNTVCFAQSQEIPPQVWNVTFEGNEHFPKVVLEDRISTQAPGFFKKLMFWRRSGYELNETELKKDIVRLENFYRRRGFIDIKIAYRIDTGNRDWKRDVFFSIDESEPVQITNLHYSFSGKTEDIEEVQQSERFQEAQKNQPYQKNTRFETIREPEVVGEISEVLKNLGYAYAEVSIQAEVDSMRLTADVTIHSNIGPNTYIDSIEVQGLTSISKSYVLREAELGVGQKYSLSKLQEAQKELFNHHLFRFATITIPEQPRDTSLSLLLRIRENTPRSIELQGGFGSEEKLRGQLSWTHRNVWGRGNRFTISGHASFIEQSANIDYLFPYVFNTKSSFVVAPFFQHLLESNYELLRGGLSNSFIYRYSDNLTGTATYEYTRNKELSQRSDVTLPDSTLQYNLSSFKFSSYYTQGFGRTQKGWVIQPYFEVSGLLGLAEYTFQKASLDIRRYTPISSSTTVATRVQGGNIFGVNADSLASNIRFYLGGTNSVRGWSRHELGPKQARFGEAGFERYVPLGGRVMVGFNLELRQDVDFLINNFGIAAFLDGGQVWQTYSSSDSRPLQYGAGGGLRYQSPIGPLRIDIGYKLNPTDRDLNRYEGEDYGSTWDRIGIHFSIGQAF
jgi:outer membrane protein insertion porin family